ncbi:hypothetical protein LG3211_2137 [Lysobacter gummosus]|nr:hypothetical protein LG3211_2137 [Lysobacter gummosus]
MRSRRQKARFGGLFRGRDKAFWRRFLGREIDVFEDVFFDRRRP